MTRSSTGNSVHLNDARCAMFHGENIREFAAAYLADTSPLHPFASQVYGNLTAVPPLLLQAGSDELLLDDARRVHDKVRAAGGTSKLDVHDGMFHGWHMFEGLIPEAGVALGDAAAFMNDIGRRNSAVGPMLPELHA